MAAGGSLRQIRVGNSQPRQDSRFHGLHPGRIVFPVVGVTQEMQRPVHDQVGQMLHRRLALLRRLPQDDGQADDQVAEFTRHTRGQSGRTGKGEDIGGARLVPPGGIEAGPFREAHQSQGDGPAGGRVRVPQRGLDPGPEIDALRQVARDLPGDLDIDVDQERSCPAGVPAGAPSGAASKRW